MKCPRCEVVELVMTDRSGVEVDYCPACRGVWLDRGELDKVIERNAAYVEPMRGVPPSPGGYGYRRDDDDDDRYRHDERYQKRKRRGILGEIFDFD